MDRVLVIEGNENWWDVAHGLRHMGFDVEEESNGADGLQRVKEELHHVIMMDETLPPVSSTGFLAALREVTERPVVVIGRGGETTMVEALLGGADLYVERSMPIRELAARIRALARRCRQYIGVDGILDSLGDGGQLSQVFEELSQTELKLLRFLLERDGQLTAREELMARVWGERAKETSLRFYIWQLRRKLNGVGRIEILNMKGMGYLLKVHPGTSPTP